MSLDDAMARIRLCMDDRLVEVIDRGAKLRNISKSKFVAELVENYSRERWAESIEQYFGCIDEDFPMPDDLPLSLNRKLEPL